MAVSAPQVVNRHWYRTKGIPSNAMYIGRGTPLGNPFTVGQHGVAALPMYRRWLWDKIRSQNPAVMQAMRSITEDTLLMCSCAPRPCHGDVVQRAWIWMCDSGMLGS